MAVLTMPKWPSSWRYCKVGFRKNAYEDGWPDNPMQFEAVWDAFNSESRCKAIGLISGPASGGIVMVDHDGWSCEPIIEACSNGVGLPDTVTVTSGRDGRWQCMYIVPEEYWDDCASWKKKTGKKDPQTGKPEQLEVRWKGCQSVIYGHHPDTDGYKWVNSPDNTDIAIAPEWVIELLRSKSSTVSVEDDELELEVKLNELINLLAQVTPAEDYDTWREIGMACHSHCSHPRALEIWKSWSKQADNVCKRDSDYDYKWKSFSQEGGITFGTLVHHAIGSKPYNSKDVWVYIASDETFRQVNNPLKHPLKKTGFDLFFPKVEVGLKRDGEPKFAPASSTVKEKCRGITWLPGKSRFIGYGNDRELNLHQPYRIGEPDDPQFGIDHVKHLYPNIAEYLFDWMAFTLQHPGKKINFAPYLVGPEGSGKNMIFEPLRWAMGDEFTKIDAREFGGTFNDYLLGTKLLIIDEPSNANDSRWHMAEALKTLLATSSDDEVIHINPKYGKPVSIPNLVNTIILTNHADAIRIKGGRRYMAGIDSKPPKDEDYFIQLDKWQQNGGSAAFVYWLMQRDLSRFNPKRPPDDSKERARIADESRTLLSDALVDLLEEFKAVNLETCMNVAKQHHKGISDAGLKRTLKELDYVIEPRTDDDGKRVSRKVTVYGSRKRVTVVRKPELKADEAFQRLNNYVKETGHLPGEGFSMF